jgi:hypothetical protein
MSAEESAELSKSDDPSKPSKGKSGSREEVTLDDIGAMQKMMETPRTKEACRRLGITLGELQFRSMADFAVPGDMPEKQQLRFQHAESKRQEKLSLVLSERAKVIADDTKNQDGPSGQFLLMMESLLDKESKRLEMDLKAQLRYHGAIERENEEQLNKEETMRSKEQRRSERRNAASRQLEAKSNQVKSSSEVKKKHNEELNGHIKAKMQASKDRSVAKLRDEELRLGEYFKAREKANFEKSEKWNKKLKGMAEKKVMLGVEKDLKGQKFLLDMAVRMEKLNMQKGEDDRNRQVRCEERQLKLQDTRSKKNRIDRQHDFRREKLQEQQQEGTERVEMLLGLKEQLLMQRKARMGRQEACKAHRATSLQRDCGVGPGQYDAHRDRSMHETPVPAKIVNSRVSHEQFVEDLANATKGNPPPGAYDVDVLATGEKVMGGGFAARMGKGIRNSYLDDAIRLASDKPAPGSYESRSQLSHIGPKMPKDYITDTGDWENAPKKFPAWAQPAAESPGPTAYTIDKFLRQENVKRMAKSMPSLSKAMFMGPGGMNP